MVYIGIDLGTTYSCVAIVENGKPKIIFNEEGGNFTPSIVSYEDNNEIFVGNHALNCPDLSRVLYDSKRLLGWEFMYRLPIAENRLLWTFDLDARNGSVGYVLNRSTAEERFILPEEVSADILRQLKLIAESYTGKPITGAVVAIPAFFQTAQIEATKRAVQMAGLELKMLIDEPIAAAIAYKDAQVLEDSNIMIFDFGGGTLDINICEIENGKLAIKAVHGDDHLGGQDFDGIIMNYVLQEYENISTFDILGNKRLVKRLRTECRLAKEALSFTATSYNIHLDIGSYDHLDLNVQLTKIKFNELCEELYARTSNLIDDTLRMANLGTDEIDHVILIGGSTRIPAIRDILEMKFGKRKLKFNINPDEAVVFGAAILADAIEKKKQIPLIDNTMVELNQNINNLPIGGDNSFDNSHEILFYCYYQKNGKLKGRICLFNSLTCSVEEIAKFDNFYGPNEVATTQDKIFGINSRNTSFEIYDLDTRQISGGPNPLEWRDFASVAYFKYKLYYLGGKDPETEKYTNRVDVLIDGKWKTGPAFPLPISFAQTITCDEILYVIDGWWSQKIFRLSDDEREWIEVGELPGIRDYLEVASLNGKLYITGGWNDNNDNEFNSLKLCLCFDPSAPVGSRISRIADMNYAREHHSLIVASEKLYAIGGISRNAIEEYNPQTNKWQEVGGSVKRIKKINPRKSSEKIKKCSERATECIDSCSRIETALEEWVTTLHEASKLKSSTKNMNAQNVDSATRTVVDKCEAAVGSANSLIINCSNASYIIRKNDSGISVQQMKEYLEFVNKVSDIANELKSRIVEVKDYAKSGASVDKIKILQESMDEVKKKLTKARDATPMFSDGDKMKQIIDDNPSNSDIEEVGEIKESKGSNAEKFQNIQLVTEDFSKPTQSPDFTSIKNAVLMSLSECASSPPLPHGLAEDLLDYVFFFCVGCRECSLIAIDQFTPTEKKQLKRDLLVAIPHLEDNLSDTYNSLAGESVAGFRRTRSGLQFLQDDIASRLNNSKLKRKMADLLQSEFVKEIDRRLEHWKQNREWDPDEHLDLRFIPESHDWYLEGQRKTSKQKYGAGK